MLRTTWRKLETELRDGLRHRNMAKASGQRLLSVPVATAPACDPTDERQLETSLWRGVRHLHRESRRQQLPLSSIATAPVADSTTTVSFFKQVAQNSTDGCFMLLLFAIP